MIVNRVKTLSKDYSVISKEDVKINLGIGSDYVDADTDKKVEDRIKGAVDYCEDLVGGAIVPQIKQIDVYDFSGDEIVIDESDFYSIQDIIVDGETGNTSMIKYVNERYTYFTIVLNEYITADTLSIIYNAQQLKENYLDAIIIKASDLSSTESSNYSYQTINNNTIERLLGIYVRK